MEAPLSSFEAQQKFQEACEDLELRRRRREVELKRLQVEDAKLELERASLGARAHRQQQHGRGLPGLRGGLGSRLLENNGGNAPNHASSLLLRDTARALRAPPQQAPLVVSPGSSSMAPTKYNASPSVVPAAASRGRKQRRGQGSLERRREARAAAREAALAQAASSAQTLPLDDWRSSFSLPVPALRQQQHATTTQQQQQEEQLRQASGLQPSAPAFEPAAGRGLQNQMGSEKWGGWTMIADMLRDEDETHRASAVQTLRFATEDLGSGNDHPDFSAGLGLDHHLNRTTVLGQPPSLPHHLGGPQPAPLSNDNAGLNSSSNWGKPPPLNHWEAHHRRLEARRTSAARAVIAAGGVAPIVDLLSDSQDAETQIAAADLLRNVVSLAVADDDRDNQQWDTKHHQWGSTQDDLLSPRSSQHSPGPGHHQQQQQHHHQSHLQQQQQQQQQQDHHHFHQQLLSSSSSLGGHQQQQQQQQQNQQRRYDDYGERTPSGDDKEQAFSSSRAVVANQVMDEADIVRNILNLLESDDASVRSSALGTVSELAHASEVARQQFFQDPILLTSLLEFVEHSPDDDDDDDDKADDKKYKDDDDDRKKRDQPTTLPSEEREAASPEDDDDGASEDEDRSRSTHYQQQSQTPAALYFQETRDRAQAMGVLKLMLDEEESAQRVREAIADRPGVVESIVDVATLAPPPHDASDLRGYERAQPEAQGAQAANDALVGLGTEARELAVNAVVHVLEQGLDCDTSSLRHHQARDGENKNRPFGGTSASGASDDDASDDDDDDDEKKKNTSSVSSSEARASLEQHRRERAATTTTYEEDLENAAQDEYQSHQRRRRQLAAMATIRHLITTPSDTAAQIDEAQVQEMERASLRAVRSAGGVDAVVELLGDEDPQTQASASATLRALVRADDEARRHKKRQRKLMRLKGAASCSESDITNDDMQSVDDLLSTTPSMETRPQKTQQQPAGAGAGAQNNGSAEGSSSPLLEGGVGPLIDATTLLESVPAAFGNNNNDDNNPHDDDNEYSLRAELAMSHVAVPRLVSVLSKGKDQPGAAVQAAATLVQIVEGDDETSTDEDPESGSSPKNKDDMGQEATSSDVVASSTRVLAIVVDEASKDSRTGAALAASSSLDTTASSETVVDNDLQYSDASSIATTRDTRNSKRSSAFKADLRQQLKRAIADDSSVIAAVVDLLQDALEVGDTATPAVRSLAETLRAVASSDLVNQMRIRDAGGVRPLMAVLANIRETIVANDDKKRLLLESNNNHSDATGPPTSGLGPSVPPGFADASLGKAWLSSEAPLHTDASVDAPPLPREAPADAGLNARDDAIEAANTTTTTHANDMAGSDDEKALHSAGEALPLPPPSSASSKTIDNNNKNNKSDESRPKVRCLDDIGVRLGPRSAEFSHESHWDRILQQPAGFRRWFLTHNVTDRMKQRAEDARSDRAKLDTLLDTLRAEEAALLRTLGAMNGASPQEAASREALLPGGDNAAEATTTNNLRPPVWRDENLVQRYDRLQLEVTYVTTLIANVDRECELHFRNQAASTHALNNIANDPDNAMAELHLLESTFAVLGDLKPPRT